MKNRIEPLGLRIEDGVQREIKSLEAEAQSDKVSSEAQSQLNPQSLILSPESRRMQWRCRRGLLELDIFLQPFVSQKYASLSAAEWVVFEALLDLPDNTLWDMMSGRQNNDDPAQSALLEKIKSV